MSLFPTTRSSIVLALASGEEEERSRAFGVLVAVYWKPLYKYLRIARRDAAGDAEDLTQGFLARMLENDALAGFDAAKGSFRTFLRTLFDRHVANERKAAHRQKRGGGVLQVDFAAAEEELLREHDRHGSPEDYFHREWVRSVFGLAVERLREASSAAGFAVFEAYDLAEDSRPSYRELGARLGMTETAVTNRLAAMRRRFREAVLAVLREATASEREYRAEVRAVLGVDR